MWQMTTLADQPISDAHLFGFSEYASLLASRIASQSTRTPIVIGVDGEWGTGKTSLLLTTKSILDNRAPSNDDRKRYGFLDTTTRAESYHHLRSVKTVWFNAWKYTRSNDVLAALLLRIIREMRQENFWERLKAEWADVLQREWGPIIGRLLGAELDLEVGVNGGVVAKAGVKWDYGDALEEFFKGSRLHQNVPFYEDFQLYFNKLIRLWTGYDSDAPGKGGVLAVFVDDLDRAPPDRVAGVLEALNLFLDSPGCVFVVAADVDTLASAVETHYSENIVDFNGREYLEKIFQWTFHFPPLWPDDIGQFVSQLVSATICEIDQVTAVAKAIDPNLRKIKRYVNSVAARIELLEATPMYAQMARTEEGIERRFACVVAECAALELYYSDFYEKIEERPDLLLGAHLVVCSAAGQENLGERAVSSDVVNEVASLIPKYALKPLLSAFPVHSVGLPTVEEVNLVVRSHV